MAAETVRVEVLIRDMGNRRRVRFRDEVPVNKASECAAELAAEAARAFRKRPEPGN